MGLSMKHGTLSDRVHTGSAVHFHLSTNERSTPKSSTFTASNALVADLVAIYPSTLHMSSETSSFDETRNSERPGRHGVSG